MSATRAAVITVSTSRAAGEGGEDESGPALAAYARRLGAEVIATEVIPDDRELIAGACTGGLTKVVRARVDDRGHRVLADDVTPEATTT